MTPFAHWPPVLVFLSCSALAALIAFADFTSGAGIKPTILYVIPVTLGAWFANRGTGIAMAVLAVALWLAADVHLDRDVAPMVLVWNGITRLGLFLLIALFADGYRTLLLESSRLARIDPLTGLPNRRAFIERAEREITRARRYGTPVSLAYVDVDDFKRVNDIYGHEQGDQVLRAVGDALGRRARAADLPARVGGDEFVVLLPDTPPARARHLVDGLNAEIERTFAAAPVSVRVSIGMAGFDEAPATVSHMLAAADASMYAVKQQRRQARPDA